MEKGRSTKVIAIVALLIAVVGLSVGFASFSNSLKISSKANVSPDSTQFDVNFSSVNTEEKDGIVIANPSVATISGDNANINNSGDPTITGLKANFTEPGQSVAYSFYAHNNGKYAAFLNSVVFENVTGETVNKVCTAIAGTTQSLVDTVCNSISVNVKIGTENYTGSVANISNHSLIKDAYERVEVTIDYAADGKIADGDFTVEFGDIVLVYSSTD